MQDSRSRSSRKIHGACHLVGAGFCFGDSLSATFLRFLITSALSVSVCCREEGRCGQEEE